MERRLLRARVQFHWSGAQELLLRVDTLLQVRFLPLGETGSACESLGAVTLLQLEWPLLECPDLIVLRSNGLVLTVVDDEAEQISHAVLQLLYNFLAARHLLHALVDFEIFAPGEAPKFTVRPLMAFRWLPSLHLASLS